MARVLIADDDKEIVRLFGKLLAKEGYTVFAANGGQEAIAVARKEIPDLIILDVNMPDKDGGQVAQELRESDQTKNIPIVFLTSIVSEKEAIETDGKIGGRSFISKYSDSQEIIRHIRSVVPVTG